jgi:hypothetical protein
MTSMSERTVDDEPRNSYEFFGYLMAISCVVFVYELTNLSLSLDEELHFWGGEWWKSWIAEGRWGTALLSRFVLPFPIFPFLPLFLALAGNAIAYMIVVQLWNPRSRGHAEYIAAPFVLGFPTLIHLYSFNSLNWAVGFGFVIVACGLNLRTRAVEENQPILNLWALFCFSFGIAIYQSLTIYLIVIYLVQLAGKISTSRLLSARSVLLDLARFGAVLLGSLLLYQIVSYGSREFFQLETKYLDQFNKFDLSQRYLAKTSVTVFREIVTIFSGTHEIFGARYPIVGLSLGLCFYSIIRSTRKLRAPYAMKWTLLLIYVAIVVAPFSLNLLSQGSIPYRTLVALPIAIGGIVIVAARPVRGRWRVLAIGLAAMNLMAFSIVSNKNFYAANLSYQHDREVAIMILDDIRSLVDLRGEHSQPIIFTGHHKFERTHLNPKVYSSTVAESFFGWDKVTQRVISFYDVMGQPYFRRATGRELKAVKGLMPKSAWPSKKSVVYREGIVLVNLGKNRKRPLGDRRAGAFP